MHDHIASLFVFAGCLPLLRLETPSFSFITVFSLTALENTTGKHRLSDLKQTLFPVPLFVSSYIPRFAVCLLSETSTIASCKSWAPHHTILKLARLTPTSSSAVLIYCPSSNALLLQHVFADPPHLANSSPLLYLARQAPRLVPLSFGTWPTTNDTDCSNARSWRLADMMYRPLSPHSATSSSLQHRV